MSNINNNSNKNNKNDKNSNVSINIEDDEDVNASVATEAISFPEKEKEILKFWQDNLIFEKSLQNTRAKTPYIFYDGPPFATGLPHHGHLVASTLKDIVPRYFTMKGYYVSRRFGWDCHGLPIEQEIDKKFEMSAHEYVKKHGIKSYNDECRGIVLRYTKEWEKTVRRLGRWVDFKDDYKTMDLSFMESIWWAFKRLWDLGLIYKGEKVVPISTAFGSVLSNFEATSNYKDVQDPAITILFKSGKKVVNDDGDSEELYFAAWTTTPWTLPSNLSLCVNEEIEYVRARDPEKKIQFYMAKDRFDALYGKKFKLDIKEILKGKDLVGMSYVPLFPYLKELESDGAFKVLADDYVTIGDGTGIVHQAPAFGEDDYRVMKKFGFKPNSNICPVDEYGKFTKEVTDYVGMYVKDADKIIIRRLKEEGLLYDQATIVHSYPFCPRTDTPLIYRAISSWYVNVEKIKEDLIKCNQQINWVPDHIKDGRFGKWLEGARDWAISRNRVWGTPIPIWQNDVTEKFICIGSLEELQKYSGVKINDLHRENVDPLTFSIAGEEGTYKRITDVLDCWFESGSMPYSQLHYPFENKEIFEKTFPAEFIAEGLDQTRGWFYTLTVLSTALFKRPAFKNVIVNGLVLAKDGRKMSKRLQNYTAPDILMEQFGADALRLFLINSGLVRGEELRFNDDGVKDMVRRVLLPWFNSYKFFKTYAEIDGWNSERDLVFGNNILDRWILSRLQTLIATVTKEMDGYHLYNVVPALFKFIDELTNWYIRLNRRRFWEKGLELDKKEAYSTLYTTIKDLTTMMAPFAPFLSESIFQELKKLGGLKDCESVHLLPFPVANEKMIIEELEDAVGRMEEIVLLGRQIRNQVQIKVKTPLKSLTVVHKAQNVLSGIKNHLEHFIKNELNVKEIHYSTEEGNFIKLFAKPNAPVLGKRLGKRFAVISALISKLTHHELEKVEKGEGLTLEGEKLESSDILVYREAKEGGSVDVSSSRFITIKLDTKLDPDLIMEGLAREIVNRIQRTRKDMNLNVAQRINIFYLGDQELEQVMQEHNEYISNETLAKEISKETAKEENKSGKDESGAGSSGGNLFTIEKRNINLRIVPLKM
ncbi:MAG: isoleucine--tRNA ligase [Oligoflexia bacterium]|nr:isoleucine--tRNA ligase [Oligoflexia bacterium]